ncbi:MAG: hypothetical protein K6G26_08865 [Lachnospiraceae bacterium]|nr:hypothetical protein [Lachnospiraceae bacterium]
MMVVSLLLVLNFSIGVSASSGYDRKEADACITISQRLTVKGGSGTGSIATPNSGQGFSPNGYNLQPGERTLNGYVKNNASPEVSLHTNSASVRKRLKSMMFYHMENLKIVQEILFQDMNYYKMRG